MTPSNWISALESQMTTVKGTYKNKKGVNIQNVVDLHVSSFITMWANTVKEINAKTPLSKDNLAKLQSLAVKTPVTLNLNNIVYYDHLTSLTYYLTCRETYGGYFDSFFSEYVDQIVKTNDFTKSSAMDTYKSICKRVFESDDSYLKCAGDSVDDCSAVSKTQCDSRYQKDQQCYVNENGFCSNGKKCDKP